MSDEPRSRRALRAARERVLGVDHAFFLDAAYRALMWRTPDDVGRREYLRALRRGELSRFTVLRRLSESTEAAKHVMFGPGFRQYVDDVATNGRNIDPSIRPVLFLHPMKCGGTSLSHGLSQLADPWPRLRDVWVDQLVCYPLPMLAHFRLVTGHLPYCTRELLPERTALCTVAREPVSRTLSHLSHLRTHGGQTALTLEAFVREDRWRAAWVDYQARQLAVDVPVRDALLGQVPLRLQATLDQLPDLDDATLERVALERLSTIEILGLSDDLDRVLRLAADLWGKPAPPPLERENTSLAPVRRDDVPAELLAEIRAGTRIDAVLYERAREIVAEG